MSLISPCFSVLPKTQGSGAQWKPFKAAFTKLELANLLGSRQKALIFSFISQIIFLRISIQIPQFIAKIVEVHSG